MKRRAAVVLAAAFLALAACNGTGGPSPVAPSCDEPTSWCPRKDETR